MTPERTTGDIGRALKQGRQDARLSLTEAAYQLRDHVPKGFWRSNEALRKYEEGLFDLDDMQIVVVLRGLAKVYGIDIPELTDDNHRAGWKKLAGLMLMGMPIMYGMESANNPSDDTAVIPEDIVPFLSDPVARAA